MSRGRRAGLAAAGATAIAGAIMVMSAVSGPTAGAAPAGKYFVCKYVGTPGPNERLQTGQNPIDVSGNAIAEDPVVVGSFFNDKQGRSFVLAQDVGQPDPDVSFCPQPTVPSGTPTPTVTVTPTITPTPTPTITVTPTETVTPTVTTTAPGSSGASGVDSSLASSPAVTTTAGNGVSGEAAGGGQAQGPIPAGVNAGLHTTDSNAGLRAWGILLMLLGGAAGLVFGLRPSRGRAH